MNDSFVVNRPHHPALLKEYRIAKFVAVLLFASLLMIILTPSQSQACACGCGVFDVGGSEMMPSHEGGRISLEYDTMNQNRNWHGTSQAPGYQNNDKEIRSSFTTIGLQYMFTRDWGLQVQIPYTHRNFTTIDDTAALGTSRHGNFGDIRLMGLYSGFSPDMSNGLIFGVKLPNGDYKFAGFDRDTAIGTGSTNSLLGAYHEGRLTKDNAYSWFIHGMWDRPFLTQGGYRPGSEVNMALGAYYRGWFLNTIVKVTPMLQVIGSNRLKDSGPRANPDNSGYNRLLLSPGIEAHFGQTKLYGDVEIPVYQRVNGNQLVAPALFKLVVSYGF